MSKKFLNKIRKAKKRLSRKKKSELRKRKAAEAKKVLGHRKKRGKI